MTTAELIAQIEDKQTKAAAVLTNWHGNTAASAEAKAKMNAEIKRLHNLGTKKVQS